MTVSEWHKIENDGDPWQPTCWLQMAHNDDDDIQSGTQISPASLAETDGLSLIRRNLQSRGISKAQELLLQPWREGTHKQYRIYLRQWELFASRQDINPIHPPVSAVLEFLTDLYGGGLGYSGMNMASSALSAALTSIEGHTVGSHPLACRLVKGMYQTRPALPRYKQIWDVQLVLDYLLELHPVSDLSLKDLTLKLVVNGIGQHGQSIHCTQAGNNSWIPPYWERTTAEQISLYVSSWASRCQN